MQLIIIMQQRDQGRFEQCSDKPQDWEKINLNRRAGGEGAVFASNFDVYNGMDCFAVIYLVLKASAVCLSNVGVHQ